MKTILHDIHSIISQSRANAVRSVNFERALMYWKIGERIVVEEQDGKERAEYGTELIKKLAIALEPDYGTGFSARQFERFRKFYRIYPNASALRTEFSWTHYKLLIAIDNDDKRTFYETELLNNLWNMRELKRLLKINYLGN